MVFAFFSPGPIEIAIILVALILLFGPKQVPAMARAVGKIPAQFKAGKKEVEAEIAEMQSSIDDAVKETTETAKEVVKVE